MYKQQDSLTLQFNFPIRAIIRFLPRKEELKLPDTLVNGLVPPHLFVDYAKGPEFVLLVGSKNKTYKERRWMPSIKMKHLQGRR